MYRMSANFYPARNPKNGYVGKANLTIGNGIRLNDISVFEKDDAVNLAFPSYRDKDGEEHSYIIPASKDAYAAMLEVIMCARTLENHFAYTKGEVNPELSVVGRLSTNQYADGYYALRVKDCCTLPGISTRQVEIDREGKTKKFVSVDLPELVDSNGKATHYTDGDGKEQYNTVFNGLIDKWTDKDGKEQEKNFSTLITRMVLSCRKRELEKKPSLNEKVKAAESKKASIPGKDAEMPQQTH